MSFEAKNFTTCWKLDTEYLAKKRGNNILELHAGLKKTGVDTGLSQEDLEQEYCKMTVHARNLFDENLELKQQLFKAKSLLKTICKDATANGGKINTRNLGRLKGACS